MSQICGLLAMCALGALVILGKTGKRKVQEPTHKKRNNQISLSQEDDGDRIQAMQDIIHNINCYDGTEIGQRGVTTNESDWI